MNYFYFRSSSGDSAPKKKPPTKDKSQQTSEGVRNGVEQGQQTDEDGQPATPPADGFEKMLFTERFIKLNSKL